MCLPSDALSQHLPSYLGFSCLGRGVCLYSCSSKVQPLLLTLDMGFLLSATAADLGRGVHLLGCHPSPRTWGSSSQPLLCHRSLELSVAAPDFGRGVAPHHLTSALSVAAGALLGLWGSRITAGGDSSHEIKRHSLEGKLRPT